MIEVKNLTKLYGSHKAISDISFTIDQNGVYGFLGPNGAGKSTTLNIITGCLAATEGEVKIMGHDILEDAEKAKSHIGFLPELPPVFPDMTPYEYLTFVAGIKNIEDKEEIEDCMYKTGVTPVKDRLIKNLSKGYRQRVGLAQAILGKPDIIILDEPTVGLDPKQIVDVRNLIAELGKEHTVILSSHILSEIQAICDKVLVISRGKLVGFDTPEYFEKELKGNPVFEIAAKADEATVNEILETVEGIIEIKVAGKDADSCEFVIKASDEKVAEAIFAAFAKKGVILTKLVVKKESLENVFMKLTKQYSKEEK